MLRTQLIEEGGTTPVLEELGGEFETFRPGASVFLHVVADANCQVTVKTFATYAGREIADVVVFVPELEQRIIGTFPPELFSDRETGQGRIEFSNPAGVLVSLFEFAKRPGQWR